MKRKKIIKTLALFFILLLIIGICGTALADGTNNNQIKGNVSTGDDGINANKGLQDIADFLSKLLTAFSAFGGIVIVFAFVYNGYKLVVAHDPQARAYAMHNFIYIVIGGLIIFGARTLAAVLKNVSSMM
ncbi:MAG: pilin [Thermovenabulum sp.]|uniref:pilin n=1 Tax=Thermovenabulum sp. TaxID=3100335 RepID=UPI003C7DFD43